MKNKIGISLGIFCALALVGFMVFANPFKVTDPADPRFDPMKFRFEDYRTHDEVAEVFRVIFPLGTPRSYIDKILVEQANAEVREGVLKHREGANPGFGFGAEKHKILSLLDPDTKYVNYFGPGKGFLTQWKISAFYNNKNELVLMYAYNTLVHNLPTKENLP